MRRTEKRRYLREKLTEMEALQGRVVAGGGYRCCQCLAAAAGTAGGRCRITIDLDFHGLVTRLRNGRQIEQQDRASDQKGSLEEAR